MSEKENKKAKQNIGPKWTRAGTTQFTFEKILQSRQRRKSRRKRSHRRRSALRSSRENSSFGSDILIIVCAFLSTRIGGYHLRPPVF